MQYDFLRRVLQKLKSCEENKKSLYFRLKNYPNKSIVKYNLIFTDDLTILIGYQRPLGRLRPCFGTGWIAYRHTSVARLLGQQETLPKKKRWPGDFISCELISSEFTTLSLNFNHLTYQD